MASGTKLHDAVRHDRCRLIARLVAEGTPVDAVDANGSTALFAAITEGAVAAVPHLLAAGADPNFRCGGGATAVHAACRRGSRALLQQLLECGGDLRLRDAQGRTPQDWAMGHADPQCRRKLLAFINTRRALAYRFGDAAALLEDESAGAGGVDGSPSGGSAAAASLRRRFGRPTPPRRSCRVERIRADGGFGVVYCSPARETGVSTFVPFVASNYLYNSEESNITWCGPQSLLQTMYWDKLKVSVKKSSLSGSHTRGPCSDIVITELEKIRRLTFHPHLLWPLAVSPVQNMDDVLLVFECVHFGSLFDVLHNNAQLLNGSGPLSRGRLLLVLQQACEALLFLHSRRWVHGCVTSHCVYLVTPCLGKLGNFEFLQRSEEESEGGAAAYAAPGEEFLDYYYNWMAPEVLAGGRPTVLSDLYQFCAVLWELFAEQVPWGSADRAAVERALTQERRGLSRRSELPPPLDTLVHAALAPDPADRDTDLEDVYQALAAAAHDEGGAGFAVSRLEQQSHPQHAGDGARTKSTPGRPSRQASATEVDNATATVIHRAPPPPAVQRHRAASTVADMSDLEELISLAEEERAPPLQLRSSPPPRRPYRGGGSQLRDAVTTSAAHPPPLDLLSARFDQVSLSSSMDPMDFTEAPKTPTFSSRQPDRPSFEACTQTEPEAAPPLRPRTRGFVPCTLSAAASMRSAFTNTMLIDAEAAAATAQSVARASRPAAATAEPLAGAGGGSARRTVRPSKPAGHSYGVSPFVPSNRLLSTSGSMLQQQQQRTVADSSGPDTSRTSTLSGQPWRARTAVVESRYRQQPQQQALSSAFATRGTSVCRMEDAILEGLEDGEQYHLCRPAWR
ncbi:inactive serine/threonine-protein kinase TEX14-like isoform X2 [Amblyomma americanum]